MIFFTTFFSGDGKNGGYFVAIPNNFNKLYGADGGT